jgi:hypothetical protein
VLVVPWSSIGDGGALIVNRLLCFEPPTSVSVHAESSGSFAKLGLQQHWALDVLVCDECYDG